MAPRVELGLPEGISDPYEVLGIARNASERDIKRAYRRRARHLHPDKCDAQGAKERFLKLQAAYEYLINPSTRSIFDSYVSREEKRLACLQQLSGDRHRFAVNLEAREAAYKVASSNIAQATQDLDRVRAENERWLEEQRVKVAASLRAARSRPTRVPAASSPAPVAYNQPSVEFERSVQPTNNSEVSATNLHFQCTTGVRIAVSTVDRSTDGGNRQPRGFAERELDVLARLKEAAEKRRRITGAPAVAKSSGSG